MDEILEPVVAGFDLPGHVGKFEPDDGMIDESLAKRLPLMCVLDRFFIADAGEADTLDDDADTLVVEIGHEH